MASPEPITDRDELSDRQVEVLVYRVLAAVIAFLLAAAIAVVVNADTTDAVDQQVDALAAAET